MDRQVIVYVRDKYGRPLPGSVILMSVDGVPQGGVEDSEGRASITVPGPENAQVRLTARYRGQQDQVADLAAAQDDWTFTFNVVGGFSPMTRNIVAGVLGFAAVLILVGIAFYAGMLAGLLPLVLGGILLIVTLGLAFLVKEPSLLQQQLIRATFALGMGGVASHVPGWLNIDLVVDQAKIAAGGALAVYVITFFFVPARDK